MIALIALVSLSLAGVALVRSMGMSTLIAGNMAFRQAALQASDIGIQAAYEALPSIISSSIDSNIANQYFAVRQTHDSMGIPTTVNWATVPCRNSSNAAVTCSAQEYQVKYIIDRLCEGPAPVSDVQGKCFVDLPTGGAAGGSKKAGAAVFSRASAIYYRVTVQVTGPRNTTSYVQAVISRG